jgi:hypothetical protein
MGRFNISYYESNGKICVLDFLDGYDVRVKAKVKVYMDLLQELGPALRPPFGKKVTGTGHLFELTPGFGRLEIRIFYCWDGNKAVMLHAVEKKRQKADTKELKTAEARYRQIMAMKGENK